MFANILQIGVEVTDCDASGTKYAVDYGIGKWSIYEFIPDTVSDMIVEDNLVEHAMRFAQSDIGDVQREIIETKDVKSIYAIFLKVYDEGLLHLALAREITTKQGSFY